MRPRVLVLDALGAPRAEVARLLGRYAPGLEAITPRRGLALPPSQRASVVAILTAHVPVTHALVQSLPNLALVSLAATGRGAAQHLEEDDCAACRRRGIVVRNVAGYATHSASELTLGLTLGLLRHLVAGDAAVRGTAWNEGLEGTQLHGKTVGIVGTGTIGIEVARLFRALGCRVIGWARPGSARAAFRAHGTYVGWQALFRDADVVTLHVPGTRSTTGLVGRPEIARMKPTALLVNTSRASVVDLTALGRALRAGRLGGAGLDVHPEEPLPRGSPLRRLPRTLLTPHVGYRTHEALADCLDKAVSALAGSS